MSDYSSYPPSTLEAFQFEQLKQQQNLEFSSFHSPCDLVAPPPEFFELDIDFGLEGFEQDLQLPQFNQTFNIPRGPAGPLSTLTTSGVSDSNSEDIFSDISSFYNQSTTSQTSSSVSPTFDFNQIQMDFQRVRLPPTPPRSPPVPMSAANKGFPIRSSLSDYAPPRRSSAGDIFSQMGFPSSLGQNTVSPLHLSTRLPPLSSPSMASDDYKGDPRKKYKCPSCPRGFARAYNLKTHMGTHDPNRLKPHVCPHNSCGRSFSRKHDLGRHLVSIHRDESITGKKGSIGVGAGARSWCDTCGKGTVGTNKSCDCHDIK
ncbi:hypothetical protein DFP72DRAFT_1057404 [Ephemerocybe angulata]|uniref:C2H2-type domain-containing protein n=1 Tax=Ephemerocybe angulata TaxID=980116 RepID=A0A8H6IKL5_9AGAR|nr:hypothetical protein DFP72DRAFT_1057404 [Tulosesus angulatus]